MTDTPDVAALAGRLAALPHVASATLRAREAAQLSTEIRSALSELRRQAVVEAVQQIGGYGAVRAVAQEIGVHPNKVSAILHQDREEKSNP